MISLGVQIIIGQKKTSGFDQPFNGKSKNANDASDNPPYHPILLICNSTLYKLQYSRGIELRYYHASCDDCSLISEKYRNSLQFCSGLNIISLKVRKHLHNLVNFFQCVFSGSIRSKITAPYRICRVNLFILIMQLPGGWVRKH